jgi:hypothetical protein
MEVGVGGRLAFTQRGKGDTLGRQVQISFIPGCAKPAQGHLPCPAPDIPVSRSFPLFFAVPYTVSTPETRSTRVLLLAWGKRIKKRGMVPPRITLVVSVSAFEAGQNQRDGPARDNRNNWGRIQKRRTPTRGADRPVAHARAPLKPA